MGQHTEPAPSSRCSCCLISLGEYRRPEGGQPGIHPPLLTHSMPRAAGIGYGNIFPRERNEGVHLGVRGTTPAGKTS